MKEKEFVTAIVLAAGRGTRMGTKIQKQYLDLCGKPVLYYSLHAFQESPLIDEILLVTGEQEIEYCRKEIVEKYQLTKVRKILAGKGAYEMLMREQQISVTDDAMVVEQMLNHPIRLVYGSYENIKITTPEDLEMAEVFLKRRKK